MIEATKILSFEAAHLLSGDAGRCGNLHGHSYRVEFRVAEADGEQQDMVVDFRQLKAVAQELILERFDHAFIYNRESGPERAIAAVVEKLGMRTVPLTGRSTTERLAKLFFELLHARVPQLAAVKVWETAENYAEYRP